MHIPSLLLQRRALMLGAAAWAVLPTGARAQADWPERPIRLVLPFSAGGPGDTNVRAMAQAMSRLLGQPIMVDNRPGAGGIIGSDMVAKSAPDGYTLLSAGNGAIANPLLRVKMPYADSDLVPVVATSTAPSVIVTSATSTVKSLKDLQAYGKSKGVITFGTAGPGSTGHFVAEMVQEALGVPVTVVHYKSGSQTTTALIGGEVDIASEAPIGVAGYVRGGKLRALALTARERSGPLQDVETTVEQGFPTVQMQHWGGIYAPKGTPPAILDRIAGAAQRAYASDPDLIAVMERGGAQPMRGARPDFERFVRSEKERLAKLVADSGMKLE
ncbi:tripartite tricarboxylate transporter substrate binding protein [soil metagenome]